MTYSKAIDDVFHYDTCMARVRRVPLPRYGLAVSSRAKYHPLLAGRVVVYTKHYDGGFSATSAAITFAEPFVSFIAEHISLGLSEDKPAMVAVLRIEGKERCSVVASYTDLSMPVLLWREQKLPSWLEIQ